MTPDLSPLEQAAARAGLPGLRARVVPHDRRRDRWFAWRDGELLVSERVLERCPPAEASALLVDAIVARRHRGRALRRLLASVVAAVVVFIALDLAWDAARGVRDEPSDRALRYAIFAAGWGACATLLFLPGLVGRARLTADDEAVALLGDPVPLVRGLNLMDQDELRLGGWRLPARPDLHARAERLARIHRLREAPHPPALDDAAAGSGDAAATPGG